MTATSTVQPRNRQSSGGNSSAGQSPVGQSPAEQSLGGLLRDLSDEMVHLVRQEIRLARIETVESLHALGTGTAQLAAALILSMGAVAAAVAGIILLLSRYVFGGLTWLSAIVVAVIFGAAAWIFAMAGKQRLSPTTLLPTDTTSSLRETATWLKHPTTFGANSR